MINYYILWFEDTKSIITLNKKKLEDYFKDSDLKLNFITENGVDGLAYLDADNDIDLILMDHNLYKVKGDTLIEKVRKKNPLTDIIYYSNKPSIRANVENVEGIYFSDKGDLYSITHKIIEKSTRTINDVTIQRGNFISDVIQLEAKMVQIILKYFLIEQTGMESEFKSRIINSEFFSTMSKYTIIQNVLNEKLKLIPDKNSNKFTSLNELKKIFSKFQTEVIEMRNKLAHTEETIIEGTPVFQTKSESFTINEKGIKSARKKLRTHSENLDKLIGHF